MEVSKEIQDDKDDESIIVQTVEQIVDYAVSVYDIPNVIRYNSNAPNSAQLRTSGFFVEASTSYPSSNSSFILNNKSVKKKTHNKNKNKSKLNMDTKSKYSDETSMISIMCRICYDDTVDEPVISPCFCKGSVGMVHKSCLERWLAESNTNQCDLCNHRFETERTTKFSVPYSFYRWLRYPPNNFAFPVRDMRSDMITCSILIPFSICLIYLCLFASDYYNRHKFAVMPIARWTAISVLIMGVVIILGFSIWIFLVMRYHCRVWYFWWQRETIVRLLNTKKVKEN